jgi:AraC-like DNA-binding protein
MTVRPTSMLVRPATGWTVAASAGHVPPMVDEPLWIGSDPLGEALHALRMTGTFYCRSELTAPWGLAMPELIGCVWFHVVAAGRCWLDGDDGEPVELGPGDFALVPHGRGHRLWTEPGTPTPEVQDLPQARLSDRYAVLAHGGGGAPSTLICGVVRFDHVAARDLLALLPPVIHLDAAGSAHWAWMEGLLGFMAAEARELLPGGETVITRLADILVIQAIRAWIGSDPPTARVGWLGALRDPQLGRAVAAVVRDPGRPWSVASLARAAAMSRSAFSARFSAQVGEAPMGWVARVRMRHAAAVLAEGAVPIALLAEQLGYRSEAAFSRAFKRVVGIPPSAARGRATVL